MNGLAGLLVGLAGVVISCGTLIVSLVLSRRRDNIAENASREHLLRQSERERHRLANENLFLMRKLLKMDTQEMVVIDDDGSSGKY